MFKHITVDDLRAAIERSGFDISQCSNCSKLVVCLPDGMSNWCEECAKKEDERQYSEKGTPDV